ncbi:Uma2 family endonuclease [Aeromicrobium alkaliterrae]|uniref:Uma2 family endonuclease n=2 Tax=Aeromicrobium alkaliterrae TaxID=302168 RepID=A0ABP4VWH8_9ACTN
MSVMATEVSIGLPRGRALTRDDLAALPDDGHRYELLDGVLIVSPSPVMRHQRALARLFRIVDDARPSGLETFFAPFDVVLADDTVMQPDLLVARVADLTERDLPVAPVLAVEVLSPSTRRVDLLLKKERLERAACAHYWVVDPADAGAVTAWAVVDGAYQQVAHAEGDDVFAVTAPFEIGFSPAALVS